MTFTEVIQSPNPNGPGYVTQSNVIADQERAFWDSNALEWKLIKTATPTPPPPGGSVFYTTYVKAKLGQTEQDGFACGYEWFGE